MSIFLVYTNIFQLLVEYGKIHYCISIPANHFDRSKSIENGSIPFKSVKPQRFLLKYFILVCRKKNFDKDCDLKNIMY